MSRSPLFYVFVSGYAIAWAVAAFNPLAGLGCLLLLSFPLSLVRLCTGLLQAMILGSILTIACLVMPVFAPIIVLIPLLRLLVSIVKNFKLAFGSIVLYCSAIAVPFMVQSNILAQILPETTGYQHAICSILQCALGASVAIGFFRLLEMLGHPEEETANFVLGFPGFMIGILLFIINAHNDGGTGGHTSSHKNSN